MQTDADGKKRISAVVLVSEVIELSALFGTHCVFKALEKIPGIGSLNVLILGFDCGTPFRSYENLVEKHGKSMADSKVFSPNRRCITEWLMNKDAFADDECSVVSMLRAYAAGDGCQSKWHSIPHRSFRAA